ncbi:CDK12 kinase, partial [Dicaeum eximium]|nr:CDK12 kinase [Dicaeum eximium]
LPHWQDCHELWSKKRRRQRQSGMAVEEPPVSKVSRKETTSVTSTDTVKNNNSSPVPPQPAQLKAEPGAADAVGLGDITQQLNQSELAVLLNLLQSQTDLSVPQMAQLLNVHSNPEMQQQLEALNQSITALTEATAQQQQQQQQHEPAVATEEAVEEPPEEQQSPEAAGAQGDMQNVLAVLLSQLMKSQEPGITLEESNGDKSGEQRAPRKSPARHPEESTAQELNPAVTAALLQLLSQPDPEPPAPDFSRSLPARTYSTDGSEELNAGQTLLEPSAQPLGKSRTFLGSVSHLGESSSYQGTGSVQFPGDQDLRFARVPVAIRFGKSEGSGNSNNNNTNNNVLVHPEAKVQSYGELGPGTAGSSGAGTAHSWGAPTQAPPSYGKAFRGPGRVPPRGGRGRGVPY